jgi:hypothetical protein
MLAAVCALRVVISCMHWLLPAAGYQGVYMCAAVKVFFGGSCLLGALVWGGQVVCWRRFTYEQEIAQNPLDYDA